MDAFPAFFPLRGKRVVIAGDGELAEAKARLFEGSPAEVVRVEGEAAFAPETYAGADLVFVASFDAPFREAAAAAARASGALLNVADAPELGDFHTPAIVDRGAVVAAIGTAGASPLLASLLRAEIEVRVPEGAGRIAALLGARREAVRTAFPDLALRRAFLRALLVGPAAQAAAAGEDDRALALIDAAIAGGPSAAGRVALIAGVDTPDRLSLRAARVLASADVLVADAEAAALLASHGRRDAERLDPARADLAVLAGLARAGRIVAVLARTADGALSEALTAAGIAVETYLPSPAP